MLRIGMGKIERKGDRSRVCSHHRSGHQNQTSYKKQNLWDDNEVSRTPLRWCRTSGGNLDHVSFLIAQKPQFNDYDKEYRSVGLSGDSSLTAQSPSGVKVTNRNRERVGSIHR